MRKGLLLSVIVFLLLMGSTVHAETYYTNHLGVSFTREQYDLYTYLAHEGFQEHVTQDMLDEFANETIDTLDITKVGMCPNPMQQAHMGNIANPQDDDLFVITSAKSLEMSNACNGCGYCRVFAYVEWFGEPNQKSYDLFGAFTDGVTRMGAPLVIVETEDDFSTEEVVKYETDGFGAVVPVLDGDDLTFDMSFPYTGTGSIFISYQHAMSYISLADAQLFHIDFVGYGNVFDFYGAAIGVYDEMPGVHMNV